MNNTASQIILLVIAVTILIVILIITIIALTIAYQKNQANHLLTVQHIKLNHQNILLVTRLEIQEETFNQISKEIHDNIGQKLTIVKLNLIQSISQKFDVEQLTHASNLLDETMNDLRRISKNLDSDFQLRDGLIPALNSLKNELEKQDYLVEFKVIGQLFFINNDNELILFRIAQEAINNILKHSRANKIIIELNYSVDFLSFVISDNGIGIEHLSGAKIRGAGLNNINSRAKALKAECIIESALNLGTKISLKIPLQHEHKI